MQEHYSKTEMVFFSETLRVGFVQFLFSDVDHWKDAKLIAKSTKIRSVSSQVTKT